MKGGIRECIAIGYVISDRRCSYGSIFPIVVHSRGPQETRLVHVYAVRRRGAVGDLIGVIDARLYGASKSSVKCHA